MLFALATISSYKDKYFAGINTAAIRSNSTLPSSNECVFLPVCKLYKIMQYESAIIFSFWHEENYS